MASHHTHVAIGLLAGTVVATTLHLGPAGAALFALSSGGAALLPDADTPDSAVSHAGGLVMKIPLWFLRRAMVEHRGLSHTMLACLGVSFGTFWLGHFYPIQHGWLPAYWPTRILIPALLAMLATRSVLTFGSSRRKEGEMVTYRTIISRRHRFYLDALVGITIAYLGSTLGSSPHFTLGLAMAVGTGFLSHLLADAVFNGVPLTWPIPPSLQPGHRFTISRFRTGGVVDHLLGWSSLLLAIYLFLGIASLSIPFGHLFSWVHL